MSTISRLPEEWLKGKDLELRPWHCALLEITKCVLLSAEQPVVE